MAEFCFKCFQVYFDDRIKKRNLTISNEIDLCEGCGRYTNTVITDRRPSFFYVLRNKDIYKYNQDETGWEEARKEILRQRAEEQKEIDRLIKEGKLK